MLVADVTNTAVNVTILNLHKTPAKGQHELHGLSPCTVLNVGMPEAPELQPTNSVQLGPRFDGICSTNSH